MKIDSSFLNRLTKAALKDFFVVERKSIMADVAERNLCGRLAMHYENQMKALGLNGYFADPEYNRKQEGQVKTILLGKEEVVQITCDLIIHSRGENIKRDNLIALEMAKPNKSKQEMTDDRNRLMALTKSSFDGVWSYDGKTLPEHVCGYTKGYYLIIDPNKTTATLEMYNKGAESAAPLTMRF